MFRPMKAETKAKAYAAQQEQKKASTLRLVSRLMERSAASYDDGIWVEMAAETMRKYPELFPQKV